MSHRPPNDSLPPESPDELKGGLRGPVSGVTRIGPRAFGLAFVVICGLLAAVLFGLNRGSAMSKGVTTQAFNTPPPAPVAGEDRFGADEPLVVPSAPDTPPPPLILAATPAPNLDDAEPRRAPAAQAQQPVNTQAVSQVAEQARAAADEARAEEQRRRREVVEAALKSPILTSAGPAVFSGNGVGSGVGASSAGYSGGGQNVNAPARTVADAQPAQAAPPSPSAFLNGPTNQYAVQAANVNLPEGGNPKDFLQAQRFAPISPYEIVASSVIPAAMITAIDSDLPGLISAQVREDVYDSKTGRFLLIPRGARLVGLYKNDLSYGQSRVLVAWTRLIFPDTTSIDLEGMSGADVEGSAGVAGKVDNHYGNVFGAAILTSVLASGVALAQPRNTSIFSAPSAGQVLSQSVGTQIANTGTQILQKNLNVPPTIRVPRGYPFVVIVDRDIVLPGPYVSNR